MPCQVNDENVEQVKEMKYFGVLMSSESLDTEVKQRVGMAAKIDGAVRSKYSVGNEGINTTEHQHECGNTM